MPKITVLPCKTCNKEFIVEYKRRHTIYCSKNCYWKDKKGKHSYPMSKETKEKISLANKGKLKSQSVKDAVAEANRKRVWRPESIEKIRKKAIERAKLIPKKEKIRNVKKCKICEIDLPYERGNRQRCDKCSIIHRKEYVTTRKNDETVKYNNNLTRIKRKYGVTDEYFSNILKKQNYKCAICKKKLEIGRDKNIDHCHITNIVRGILCSKCNLGLGHFADNISFLLEAIKYLKEAR